MSEANGYMRNLRTKFRSKIIPEYGDASVPAVRMKYGSLEAWVSIIGNILMFCAKFCIGILINSIALITDAFHTLSDTATSGVVLLGFKASTKAPDKEHPFGHGRGEHIATVVIAVILAVVGVKFMYDSIDRFIHPQLVQGTLFIALLMIVFGVLKELMAWFSMALGKKIDSSALIADAWHHRVDAITNYLIAVAIFGIAIFGPLYNYIILDAILGIVISVLIIYTGYKIAATSADALIGKVTDKKTLEFLNSIAVSVKGVKDVHEITVHDYSGVKAVSMHVNVEPNLSTENAHEIANKIEKLITEDRKICALATVHVEPYYESGKEKQITDKEIAESVERIACTCKSVLSCHDICVKTNGADKTIAMHIVVDKDMSVKAAHKLEHKIIKIVQEKHPNFKITIHIEPHIK